jgi:ferredoxin
MKTKITSHQLNFLLEYILANFETFGPRKIEGKLTFAKIDTPNNLDLSGRKTPLSFKKILTPNKIDTQDLPFDRKIAFLALPGCDIEALRILLNQFPEGVHPKKENILVMGITCRPDKFCFCDRFEEGKPFWDLFLEEAAANYNLYSNSNLAKLILNKTGIKYSPGEYEKKKIGTDGLNQTELKNLVENKEKNEEFWQGIADNCFGCGACTTVCPLCYCTRQEIYNKLDGSCTQCLNWDSCFAKRFSEVQNHYDLRPENINRLYNWYHHKFVRAKEKQGEALCTGCGRCISACPANLNINLILKSLVERNKD